MIFLKQCINFAAIFVSDYWIFGKNYCCLKKCWIRINRKPMRYSVCNCTFYQASCHGYWATFSPDLHGRRIPILKVHTWALHMYHPKYRINKYMYKMVFMFVYWTKIVSWNINANISQFQFVVIRLWPIGYRAILSSCSGKRQSRNGFKITGMIRNPLFQN